MKDYTEDDVLMHYGVLGMRWGVRKDRKTGVRKGKPTKGTKAAQRKANRTPSEDYSKAKDIRKKSVQAMTNKELNEANQRTRLEKEYANLHGRGKSRLSEILKNKALLKTARPYLTNLARMVGNEDINKVADMIDKHGDMAIDILIPKKKK